MKKPIRCQRIDLPGGRSLRTPSQKHFASSATGGASVLLRAPRRTGNISSVPQKKRTLTTSLLLRRWRDLNRPLRCRRIALPAGRPLRTPSQKHLASSATGGASVLLPAPRRSGNIFSVPQKKRTLTSSLLLRRWRDLNPRAARTTYTLSRGASSAT